MFFAGLLGQAGFEGHEMALWQRLLAFAAVAFASVVLFFACKKMLVPLAVRVSSRVRPAWMAHLLARKVVLAGCHLVPPLVFCILLPLVLGQEDALPVLLSRLARVYLTVMSARFLVVAISSLRSFSEEHGDLKDKPLRGVYQMMKIIVSGVAAIVLLGIILDRDVLALLAGLGASAAVLSLVFKDTVMGLVAGVQLSSNDMLRPGDWIRVDSYGVDGIVFGVSLTTVKVRNWDMTIVTLPPYALVSGSFQNWRGMWENKGRRIMRQILIDTSSVRFCTDEEVKRFEAEGWLDASRSAPGVGGVVNLSVYRNYIMKYLSENDKIASEMLTMVRQLEMTGHGLPLQVYCFARTISIVDFEEIQNDVMEHVMAVAPLFGLRIYQRPSGEDLSALARRAP